MLDKTAQREGLLKITEGDGFGILMICTTPGDVIHAVSPVPELVGYEFVFASPYELYDIWKDDKLILPDLSLEDVRRFIRERTPEWLYDDSEPTEEQSRLVNEWVEATAQRYS